MVLSLRKNPRMTLSVLLLSARIQILIVPGWWLNASDPHGSSNDQRTLLR